MRLVPETKDTPFRLYKVDSPTAIAATTKAPLGIVVGAHLGETAAATRHIEALTAAGANVLWDVGDLPDTTLPDPWPVRQVKRLAIDRWTVTDRAGRIA